MVLTIGKSDQKGRRPRKYVCPVPAKYCTSSSKEPKSNTGFHGSPESCRACEVKYLLSLGYEKVTNREWLTPDKKNRLILDKTIRVWKPGKAGRPMLRRPVTVAL